MTQILIIDDSELVREELALIIEDQGWYPLKAATFGQAIQLLYLSLNIQLVVTCWTALGDLEVSQILSGNTQGLKVHPDKTPLLHYLQLKTAIPILLFSGHPGLEEIGPNLIDMGWITGFLSKPATPDKIISELKKYLRSGGPS